MYQVPGMLLQCCRVQYLFVFSVSAMVENELEHPRLRRFVGQEVCCRVNLLALPHMDVFLAWACFMVSGHAPTLTLPRYTLSGGGGSCTHDSRARRVKPLLVKPVIDRALLKSLDKAVCRMQGSPAQAAFQRRVAQVTPDVPIVK